jgi:uncharacterized delta-60 repeat protein
MPSVPIWYRIRPRRMSSQILNRRLGIAMTVLTFMRHSSALSLALVASFLVLSTILPIHVEASSGDLDSGFGVGGKVITHVGFGDRVETLAIQRDGKIIAAGQSGSRGIYDADDFALARYNTDGSLDKSFGSGGIVRTDFFGDEDHISSIALQSDGKIVAVGQARQGADIYFGVARYNTDGNLDGTFGTGGKLITIFAGHGDNAHAVVIQPDGKILVGGSAIVISKTLPGEFTFGFALARYNQDGSLDLGFGEQGKVISDFDGLCTRLVLQPDGKIIAGGTITTQKTNSDFALARYNADGSLDAAFGNGGKVTTDFNKWADSLSGLALQADGKIVVAGDVDPPDPLHNDSQPCVARYNPDGSLDSTFGNRGTVIDGNFTAARAIALQDNGKIIVAGLGSNQKGDGDFALARYMANGNVDTSFGNGGMITTSFLGSDDAFALALLPDGRIIAAGATYGPEFFSGFALARYNNADDRFDLHLQGKNNSCLLRLNSTTGEYLFTDCDSGFTLAGKGTLRLRRCKINLEDSGSDFSLSVKVKSCALTAKISLEILSQSKTFVIRDSDITDALAPCS